jgi:hypothetical protein
VIAGEKRKNGLDKSEKCRKCHPELAVSITKSANFDFQKAVNLRLQT